MDKSVIIIGAGLAGLSAGCYGQMSGYKTRIFESLEGSYMGWRETPRIVGKYMKRSLPGLDNFYMAGQWVYMGGGIPGPVMSGRNLMQIICKRDKRKFETSTP